MITEAGTEELFEVAKEIMKAMRPIAEPRQERVRVIVLAVQAVEIESPRPGTKAYAFGNHIVASNMPPDCLGPVLLQAAEHEMKSGNNPLETVKLTAAELFGKGTH